MKKVFSILISLIIFSGNLLAQTTVDNTVPMADKLREDGKIWVVVAVIAVVFAGIAINMIRLELRVGKIEKELNIK
ncbi:CcmD family protein [Dyadobacter sp. NIV53]|uniref:CcmD family protein n=1 Tax=Dyadobacter sp. NIV53 TaxID=2861765 RepID=UPI001C8781E9|nr:CcmD family protein [Dyadobacter sp. NIV53]